MSGHLLVPAYDPDLPATLSPRILDDLLRQELGFEGMIVTDAIEMGAVTDRYGIDGATVQAVVAGADAICVGGENAEEATVDLLADALADAVVRGDLSRGATRGGGRARPGVRRLVGRPGPGRHRRHDQQRHRLRGRPPRHPAGRSGPGTALPLSAAPHVVELVATTNLAIGKETPWGVAAPLLERLPGTTIVRVRPPGAADRRHRPGEPARWSPPPDARWSSSSGTPPGTSGWAAPSRTSSRRVPTRSSWRWACRATAVPGAVQIFTHGATAASGVAAAEVLVGAR